MIKKIHLFLFQFPQFPVVAAALWIIPLIVFSAGIVPCGGANQDSCTICHLFVGVREIINFLVFDIAFPLAALGLIYGGFLMVTAGGSQAQLKEGKSAIFAVLWGLAVTLSAWIIIDTIMRTFLAGGMGKIEDWGPWEKMPCGT